MQKRFVKAILHSEQTQERTKFYSVLNAATTRDAVAPRYFCILLQGTFRRIRTLSINN